MKTSYLKSGIAVFILAMAAGTVSAQDTTAQKKEKNKVFTLKAEDIQYFRPWDQRGINMFEPSKIDNTPFNGVKVRIGGSFTQTYQALTHSNKANYLRVTTSAPGVTPVTTTNGNFLYNTIPSVDSTSAPMNGFNLAQANLNFDIQLADGIRITLENYMSSRHHSEFWVKGGYIQIDKLPMFGNPDWFSKNVRVKIGHFQPNFGDFQMRRTDGGNAIWNPFTENLILDAFTTEIGGEVYLWPTKGKELMLMGGMTTGFISGNIANYGDAVNSAGVATKRTPSIFAKAAYDKQINTDLRVRISGSVYYNSNIQRNTLFAGDRTGSQYWGVMEQARRPGSSGNWVPISLSTTPSNTATQSGPNFTSGRIDPQMSNRITAISIDPFLKFKGLEIYGGFQNLNGSLYGDSTGKTWNKRSWNQYYGEVVYRLFNDQVYVGARYVNVDGEPYNLKYGSADAGKSGQANVNVNRIAFAAGYFPIKNLLLKVEYVKQNYNDYPSIDYRYEGSFNGFTVQAIVGF
jgi:hypothetical protein